MIDTMTSTVNALIAEGNRPVARFAWVAPQLIRNPEPSMVVGRPGAKAKSLEDEGRTLVLPLPDDCPKLYACRNETGGATVMLAEEY